MLGLLGGLLGGSLISGAVNGMFGIARDSIQANRNIELAGIEHEYKMQQLQQQSALDRQLRSTQYQDAIADMKQAGINPAALGQQIGQVSTATPSTANTTSASFAFGANNIMQSAVLQTALQNKGELKKLVKKIAVNTADKLNKNI